MRFGAGLIPSVVHTSDRCELWAIAMALAWLTNWRCTDAVLHTDSQYAVDGCWYLQRHLLIPADWRNQDFWEQILQGLLKFDGSFCVQKVDTHRAKTSASSAQDAFLIQWNSVADTAAKAARLGNLDSLLNKLECMVHSLTPDDGMSIGLDAVRVFFWTWLFTRLMILSTV